jgi:hypothetical protein
MKTFMQSVRLLSGLTALLVMAGCGSQDPTICDGSYYWVLFKVHDLANAPVTGVSIRDSIIRTHEVIIPTINPTLPAGTYVGVEDSFIGHIRESGDTVIILGDKGQSQFALLWVVDAAGGCHIRKTFGASDIVLP